MVADGALVDYALWRPGASDGFGDTYVGRVVARVPALAGCFVTLGDGPDGFLPDTAGGRAGSAGQMLAVEVTRSAQGGKGPRLATTSLGTSTPEGKPRLLNRGLDPLRTMAARYPDAQIELDDPTLRPGLSADLGARLRLVKTAFSPEIAEQVAALSDASVHLAGGAALHIEPTRALTAIDVDAGAMSAARTEKSAAQVALNHALIPALARQIRLRNLSGAIVIDLAGMPARRRSALAPALEAALAADPLRPRLLGFTALGFAEIVRPRQRPPLHEVLATPLSAGLAALRAALAQPGTEGLCLRAAPAVIAALEAEATGLAALSHRRTYPLVLQRDPALRGHEWFLEQHHANCVRSA